MQQQDKKQTFLFPVTAAADKMAVSPAVGLASDLSIQPDEVLTLVRRSETQRLTADLQISNLNSEHAAAFKISACKGNTAALQLHTPEAVLQPRTCASVQLHVLPRSEHAALPIGHVGNVRVTWMRVASGME